MPAGRRRLPMRLPVPARDAAGHLDPEAPGSAIPSAGGATEPRMVGRAAPETERRLDGVVLEVLDQATGVLDLQEGRAGTGRTGPGLGHYSWESLVKNIEKQKFKILH